jgi:hypothetical protein
MKFLKSKTLMGRITALDNAFSIDNQKELIVNVLFQSLNRNEHHVSKLYAAKNIPQKIKAEVYGLSAHSVKRTDGVVTLVYNKDKERKSLDALCLEQGVVPSFEDVAKAMNEKWLATSTAPKAQSVLSVVSDSGISAQVSALKIKASCSEYDAIESQIKLLNRKTEVLKAMATSNPSPMMGDAVSSYSAEMIAKSTAALAAEGAPSFEDAIKKQVTDLEAQATIDNLREQFAKVANA